MRVRFQLKHFQNLGRIDTVEAISFIESITFDHFRNQSGKCDSSSSLHVSQKIGRFHLCFDGIQRTAVLLNLTLPVKGDGGGIERYRLPAPPPPQNQLVALSRSAAPLSFTDKDTGIVEPRTSSSVDPAKALTISSRAAIIC